MVYDITATLEEKVQLSGDVWQFRFKLVQPLEIEFTAGQYLLLKVEGKYRQYSISSPAFIHDHFELIVQILPDGVASKFLEKLEVGGTAEFKGPAGVFVLKNNGRDKVFLATGTGIAPVKSIIETYLEHSDNANDTATKSNLHLFFGVRTRKDMYLFDKFNALASKHPNFNFYYCLSKEESVDDLGERFFAGRVTNAFKKYIGNENTHELDYYVCGGQEVVESLREFVGECGAQKECIFFEKFT